MKIKLARRAASDYELSLSSQDSLLDSILIQFQNSSAICSSHGSAAFTMAAKEWRTPGRHIGHQQRSYSEKKVRGWARNECEEGLEEGDEGKGKAKEWLGQSQDSKMRRRQVNYGYQGEYQFQYELSTKINYRQHAKILLFQEQGENQSDKQNQPMGINQGLRGNGEIYGNQNQSQYANLTRNSNLRSNLFSANPKNTQSSQYPLKTPNQPQRKPGKILHESHPNPNPSLLLPSPIPELLRIQQEQSHQSTLSS